MIVQHLGFARFIFSPEVLQMVYGWTGGFVSLISNRVADTALFLTAS
jgi:hypothetical protein